MYRNLVRLRAGLFALINSVCNLQKQKHPPFGGCSFIKSNQELFIRFDYSLRRFTLIGYDVKDIHSCFKLVNIDAAFLIM